MAQLEESQMRFRSVVAVVSAILVVGSGAIGFAWRAANTLSDIRSEFGSVHEEIKSQSAAIEDLRATQYTLARASEQALRTAIENPGMRVPDPRDPNKIIVVSAGHTELSRDK